MFHALLTFAIIDNNCRVMLLELHWMKSSIEQTSEILHFLSSENFKDQGDLFRLVVGLLQMYDNVTCGRFEQF